MRQGGGGFGFGMAWRGVVLCVNHVRGLQAWPEYRQYMALVLAWRGVVLCVIHVRGLQAWPEYRQHMALVLAWRGVVLCVIHVWELQAWPEYRQHMAGSVCDSREGVQACYDIGSKASSHTSEGERSLFAA